VILVSNIGFAYGTASAWGTSTKTTFSYGVKSGLAVSQHYGTPSDDLRYDVKTIPVLGFTGGVFLDMNILDNLSLGYELLYTRKGSQEKITIREIEEEPGIFTQLEKPAKMNIEYLLDYIELPVLIKIKAFENNRLKIYPIVGTAVSFKVGGKRTLNGKFFLPESDESFTEFVIKEDSNLSSVNMFDFGFVYGSAIITKTIPEFVVEYRFTLGWDYLQLPTYELADPDFAELRNQTYSLLLGVKF